MAPAKQTWTAEVAAASNNSLLTAFFTRKRRGRPPKRGNLPGDVVTANKKKKKRGPVPQEPKKPPPTSVGAKKRGSEEKKQRRTNWGKGEAKSLLEAAIVEWDGWCATGAPPTLRSFSESVNIPYDTFTKYVSAVGRRVCGKSVGRKPLLTRNDQDLLADVLARKDRANMGASQAESVDLVHELAPSLTCQQARRHLSRTLIPSHPKQVKPKPVVAQATTTKRSGITLGQQYRWHTTYEDALNELRRRNTGICKLSGKTFGELIHHFITGGDETCFMACEEGTVKVIGSAGRSKHEKKTVDSRISITIYRTGSVAGDTGPSVFLLAGKKRRNGFNDAFLLRNGAAVGSTIIMTETAYMTTDAWEEMTPSVCKGLRNMNQYVAANPQWFMLEIFDGFGAHLASLPAMEQRFQSKILSLKEEGDSSHVNQAYDKFVAKSDKRSKDEGIAMLRGTMSATKGVVDQWGMVHVGLYAVRDTKRDIWTRSFDACNLDPRTRVSFSMWAKKIECFLQAGQSFKAEAVDKYLLLPSFWHGMTPDERKCAIATVVKHEGYSIECLKELRDVCHILVKDMQHLRVCIECANDHPEQLYRGAPDVNAIKVAESIPDLAQVVVMDATHGLNSFLLKPPGVTGLELFSHLQYKSMISPNGASSPSHHLDVEISKSQREILKVSHKTLLTRRDIMKDISREGGGIKLAARKLDCLGSIKPYSGLVNNEEQLRKMKNQVGLAQSIMDIQALDKATTLQKRKDDTTALVLLSVNAREKLAEKDGDVSKITKKEICAILLAFHGTMVDESKHLKPALVQMLTEKMEETPENVVVP
jgi:hypothetical protein